MALLPSTLPTATLPGEDGSPPQDLAHLDHDPKLVAKIMIKRQQELERRAKLMNPRARQLGISHDVLDAQRENQKFQTTQAAATEAFYTQTALLQDQVAQACESVKREVQRQRQKDVVDYSLTHLRKEQRREYSLSDPNQLRNELPARIGDNDPRLGKSSMQQFEGESNSLSAERKKERQAQTRQWYNEQIQEKKDREDRERMIDRQFDEELITANEVRAIVETTNNEEMRQEKLQEAQENLQLVVEHQNRRLNAQKREIAQAKAHADSVCNSKMLMENVDCVRGMGGKIREFKRISLDEEMDCINTNKYLVLERKFRQQREREDNLSAMSTNKAICAVQQGIEEHRNNYLKAKQMRILEENKALAEAKRQRDRAEQQTLKTFDLTQ